MSLHETPGDWGELTIVAGTPTGEETDLAVCLSIDGDRHWLPRSRIALTRSKAFGGWLITMPAWLAKREGLE